MNEWMKKTMKWRIQVEEVGYRDYHCKEDCIVFDAEVSFIWIIFFFFLIVYTQFIIFWIFWYNNISLQLAECD